MDVKARTVLSDIANKKFNDGLLDLWCRLPSGSLTLTETTVTKLSVANQSFVCYPYSKIGESYTYVTVSLGQGQLDVWTESYGSPAFESGPKSNPLPDTRSRFIDTEEPVNVGATLDAYHEPSTHAAQNDSDSTRPAKNKMALLLRMDDRDAARCQASIRRLKETYGVRQNAVQKLQEQAKRGTDYSTRRIFRYESGLDSFRASRTQDTPPARPYPQERPCGAFISDGEAQAAGG